MPGVYHAFWGEGDDVLIGEVSTVNDDNTDNYFLEQLDASRQSKKTKLSIDYEGLR